MIIDPAKILTKKDMEKGRTPDELSFWCEKKNREFGSSKEGHHYALLKKGLAKKFYEEVFSLNLLANILYKGRTDIGCIPNLSNDNFDAIIRDYSQSLPFDLKVEFTYAVDGHDDHLRMKYLIEHGHVSLTGHLSYSGTEKTGHSIVVENEFASHYDSLVINYSLIKDRALQKCKPKNYGSNYVLVIIIDDYISPRFDKERDIEELKEFTETNLVNLPLDFGELYILGLSGKTFLTFKI